MRAWSAVRPTLTSSRMMVTRVGCEVGKPVPWANATVGAPHAKVRRAHRIMLVMEEPWFGGPAKLSRNQPFVESYRQTNSLNPGTTHDAALAGRSRHVGLADCLLTAASDGAERHDRRGAPCCHPTGYRWEG